MNNIASETLPSKLNSFPISENKIPSINSILPHSPNLSLSQNSDLKQNQTSPKPKTVFNPIRRDTFDKNENLRFVNEQTKRINDFSSSPRSHSPNQTNFEHLFSRTSDTGFCKSVKNRSVSRERIKEYSDAKDRVLGLKEETPKFHKKGIKTFFSDKKSFDCILGRKFLNGEKRIYFEGERKFVLSARKNEGEPGYNRMHPENDKKEKYVSEFLQTTSRYRADFEDKKELRRKAVMEKSAGKVVGQGGDIWPNEQIKTNERMRREGEKRGNTNKNKKYEMDFNCRMIGVFEKELAGRTNLFQRFIKKA